MKIPIPHASHITLNNNGTGYLAKKDASGTTLLIERYNDKVYFSRCEKLK